MQKVLRANNNLSGIGEKDRMWTISSDIKRDYS